jgi:hypothetical protein
MMRNVLLPCIPEDLAISGWRGPDKTNQDFHLVYCTVEVKTTSSNPHEEVAVSNVLQLDETGSPRLIMAHLALLPLQGSGETLPWLIDELRRHIDAKAPHLKSRFNTLLAQTGYRDSHSVEYARTGYTLRHARYYWVKEGFPRLKEEDLPPGVGNIRYSIVVAACAGFEISADEFKGILMAGKA